MPERESFEPIDGDEETHEIDDRVAHPILEDNEGEVPPVDSVPGMTAEELEKGSKE